MWADSLIERIEKPAWGQKRQFDVLSKKIVSAPVEVPKLFNLCRRFILSLIPLCQLDKAPSQLPLPLIMKNSLLKLKLEDFRINPLKVQAQNLQSNSYVADYIHSGQEVTLKVQNTGSDLVGQTTSFNMLTMFEDRGLVCHVLDPALPLDEILSVHRRTNQTLKDDFAWKVVEALVNYIPTNSETHHILLTSMVQVTKLYFTVFVESLDTVLDEVKQKPPELETGIFNPEKTKIWFLGVILKEILPLIASRQTKLTIEELMTKCLQQNPHERCSARFIKNLVNQK